VASDLSAMDTKTLSVRVNDGAHSAPRRCHALVVVLDCTTDHLRSLRVALFPGDELSIGRGATRRIERADRGVTLRLADPWASSHHAGIEWTPAGCFLLDHGSKNGTFVNDAPIKRHPLRDGDWIEIGGTFLVFREYVEAPAHAVDATTATGAAPSPQRALATESPRLAATLDELRLVTTSRRPLLITGETGTGKELTACAVHDLSGRPGPFVAVNCAAIPASLVESTFFGAVKGAYSGANEDRDGWVRAADRGTLFLDEIAELSDTSQAALLRVLQEGEVVPVGGTRAHRVDVRFVAATHQDLLARAAEGCFRNDLYARLSAHVIQLPPLRERIEDLGLLTRGSLAAAGHTAGLTRGAARALFTYDWPRNIRELDNALAHAVQLAGDRAIELDHLPAAVRSSAHPRAPDAPRPVARARGFRLDLAQPDALRQALDQLYREHKGNVSAVARAIGKARAQLHRWNRRLGIDPARYRDDDKLPASDS